MGPHTVLFGLLLELTLPPTLLVLAVLHGWTASCGGPLGVVDWPAPRCRSDTSTRWPAPELVDLSCMVNVNSSQHTRVHSFISTGLCLVTIRNIRQAPYKDARVFLVRSGSAVLISQLKNTVG
jgi:hypothetical protein